jgi:hypothetical protein
MKTPTDCLKKRPSADKQSLRPIDEDQLASVHGGGVHGEAVHGEATQYWTRMGNNNSGNQGRP